MNPLVPGALSVSGASSIRHGGSWPENIIARSVDMFVVGWTKKGGGR